MASTVARADLANTWRCCDDERYQAYCYMFRKSVEA